MGSLTYGKLIFKLNKDYLVPGGAAARVGGEGVVGRSKGRGVRVSY